MTTTMTTTTKTWTVWVKERAAGSQWVEASTGLTRVEAQAMGERIEQTDGGSLEVAVAAK